MILFGAFGDPGRDPRGHTVTIAYYTIVKDQQKAAKAGSDAKRLSWRPLEHATGLAFDHQKILAKARLHLGQALRLSLCDKTALFDLSTNEKKALLNIIEDP